MVTHPLDSGGIRAHNQTCQMKLTMRYVLYFVESLSYVDTLSFDVEGHRRSSQINNTRALGFTSRDKDPRNTKASHVAPCQPHGLADCREAHPPHSTRAAQRRIVRCRGRRYLQ